MKYLIIIGFIAISVPTIAQKPPLLPFSPKTDFLNLPDNWYFGEVAGVSVNSSDHIFVFNRGKHPLIEFDSEGNFVRSIGEDLFINPHGLKIDKYDNIWTTDLGTHIVLKLNPKGKLLMVLGRWKRPGESSARQILFNKPSDIAFDSRDNIYVADGHENSRVLVFNSDGDFMRKWGTKGDKIGMFNVPHTIAIDNNDAIYVGDRGNQRIQIFNPLGDFIEVWNHIGSPSGLVWTGNTFYMSDAELERVVEISRNGDIMGVFGEPGKQVGQFGAAHMIAYDSKGNLYVAEAVNWRVQKLCISE